MNKKLTIVLAVLFSASVVNAQEAIDTTKTSLIPTDSLGVHPYDGRENDSHVVIPDQSHWSMYLGAGFNVADADYTSEKKHAVWFPTVSLGGVYHWNNTWGIGMEYKFRNYKVTGSGNAADADVLLKGMSHQADLYVSFDIFNAFRPQNKKKVFALDILAGGGLLWKKNSIYYPNAYKSFADPNKINDFWFNNITAQQKKEHGGEAWKDDKYMMAGVLMVGLGAEFNVTRSIQIGLRGTYNYTTTDEIDGRRRSNNNDGFLDCEAIVRYKFEPRQKSNVRNFMVDQHIDNWNKGVFYEDPEVGAAKRAKYLVPGDGRKDTLYVITRDTIFMGAATAAIVQENRQGIRNFVVFFDNNDYELDKMAMNIASEAALLLAQQAEYQAVVVGSCDNTGATEYNKWLAVQRANNVASVLKGLGVAQDRIYTIGRGIMQDDRAEGSFSINRRVEIMIVNPDEMAAQREKLSYFEQNNTVKKTSAVRTANDNQASSSEALKEAMNKVAEEPVQDTVAQVVEEPVQEKVEEPVQDTVPQVVEESVQVVTNEEVSQEEVAAPESAILDTVVVTPNMTLSKLARQYYGNGNLWVKIFEANRDRLTSPDHLEEGVELIIPKLAE